MSKATATNGWKGLATTLLGVVWLHTGPAQAAPLNLTQQFPDIDVSSMDIAYDAGTKNFTATQTSGAWFEYSVDGSSSSGVGNWTYSLTASLDSGGSLTSGSLEIQDESSSTQLEGNLTAFGYFDDTSGNSDVFEFKFNVTGGALESDFGPLGGIIMVTNLNSTFSGDFTSGFTATTSTADTFAAVPVPAAVWLFGSGLLGLAATARRRHA